MLPILIGYISDKYLNQTTTITIGFISMLLSQIILSFSSSLYHPSNLIYNTYLFNLQNITFIIGLFFLALGTSFANLSITHIINSINDNDKITHAFSIYYPILNLGVMFGSIIMSIIINESNYHLYQWAFLFFAVILIIGFIAFHILKNRYLVNNNGEPFNDNNEKKSMRKEINKLLSKISSKSVSEIKNLSLKKRLLLFKSLNPNSKDRLIVFLIFLIIIVLYRISYSQNNIAMVFFIDSFVDRNLDFYEVPVQLFFILNPLFILILSPLFIKFNNTISEKNIKFGFIERIISAMILMVFCFLLLSILGYFLDIDAFPSDKINFIWIIITEFLIAISELLFSIAGYSLVGDLAPEKYYSLFFGLFIATRALSMYMSGQLATLFPKDIDPILFFYIPINGLMQYFLMFVVLNLIAIIIIFVLRKKIAEKIHLNEISQ